MNAEELANKCEHAKATANGFIARCPAHDDRSASLSIADGDDGKVLVKCFAGCETASVVASLGLQMSDLMPPREFKAKSEIVAAYDYRDENGTLLYQALRMVPKDFRQRKPDGSGGWKWSLNGTRRVLYQLPDLIEANESEIVFICEGEKDCDNLRKLGFIATTNVGGAGKWKPEYSQFLKGRRVCILPDNDVPGIKHANEMAASLKGIAAKVKVLELPDLPPKGDVSDWLLAGNDGDELIRLAAAAAEWTTPAQLPENTSEPVKENKVQITTLDTAASQYINKLESGEVELTELGIPDLDYALGGGVGVDEMVVLAALPSHGKSAVALQIAHTWTYNQMPCFMISEEMSPLVLGKRALQFISEVPIDQWKGDISSLKIELEDYARKRAKCFIAEPVGDSRIAIEQIDRAVQEHGIKCAIVDYTQHMSAAGNSRYEQVSNTSMAIKKCARRNKIVILALAQLNREIEKRQEFDPRLSDIGDSGQIGKDADVVIFQCWPWQLNKQRPKHEYQFFIGKNRNREIVQGAVQCEFHPRRQMVLPVRAKNMKNYTSEFDTYNSKE